MAKLDFDKRILDTVRVYGARGMDISDWENDYIFADLTDKEKELIEKAVEDADSYDETFAVNVIETYTFDFTTLTFSYNGKALVKGIDLLNKMDNSPNLTPKVKRGMMDVYRAAVRGAATKKIEVNFFEGRKCRITVDIEGMLRNTDVRAFKTDDEITKFFIAALVYASHYAVVAGKPDEFVIKLYFD